MHRSALPAALLAATLLAGCRSTECAVDPASRADLTREVQPDGRARWFLDGEPYTGDTRDDTESGGLWESSFVDGYCQGVERVWYAGHEQLEREVPMHEGREHGIVRMWYDDGSPYIEEHFRDGHPDGLQRRWSRDGVLERDELVTPGLLGR